MNSINLADGKLVESVARLTAAEALRRPISLAALQALTNAMPIQIEAAGEFVRRMRDENRY